MTSSADTIRRRPRVAGERRRPGAPTAAPVVAQPVPRKRLTSAKAPRDRHTDKTTARRMPRRWVPLVAFGLALAALATVVGVTLRPAGPSASDGAAAVASARTGLAQLLSFDYRTIGTQTTQAQALLTGSFRTEFGTTMKTQIAPLAQKNQSTVKAQVVDAGVQSQGGSTVVVQAFVDQTRTSQTDPKPVIDQNRVIATMTRVDGRWLISKLTAY